MSDPARKLQPRSLILERTLRAAFIVGGLAVVWYAIVELHRGKPIYDVVETSGIATILISSCFDPVNSAALFIPWVFGDVAEPAPLHRVRNWFFSIAGLLIVAAWVWKHW